MLEISTLSLLKSRRFLPLFLTQFLGAFNDNAFKFSMLTFISYHLSTSQAQSEQYQAIAAALFILPFFLLSATAGQLADKCDKAYLTRMIKLFEVLLMVIGGLAFYVKHIGLMMMTLTGLGIHSTFFGPIKYAILADHLPRAQLLGATAWIEASTFFAILLGTILGTLSMGGATSYVVYAVVLTSSIACLGLLASWFILPAKGEATTINVDWHVWRATLCMIKLVFDDKRIVMVILAISWFWLLGAVMLTKLPDYTHYVLGANAGVFAVFLTLFSVGIALGAMVINRLLAHQVTLYYVPHAMILFSLFTADLYWASPRPTASGALPLSLFVFFSNLTHWRLALDLGLLAFCCGLYIVPLYTYLQVVSQSTQRARTIAANNIFNALFMVLGTGLVMLLLHLKLQIAEVFLVLSLLNIGAAYIFWSSSRAFNQSFAGK